MAAASDTGISAETMVPAVGPGAFISVETSDIPPPERAAAAAALVWSYHPLTVVDRLTGLLLSRPVSQIATVDLAGEVALTKRIALGIGVPITAFERGDRLAGLGDDRPLSPPSFGDVRLRGKWVVLHRGEGTPVGLAVVGVLTLPGGGEDDFAATAGPTFEPRLVGDLLTRWFGLAANVGVRFASDRALGTTHFGDELRYGLAAAAGLWRLRGILELDGAIGEDIHPLELRGAVRFLLPHDLSIDAGVGGALIDQPTSPAVRVFAVARYAP